LSALDADHQSKGDIGGILIRVEARVGHRVGWRDHYQRVRPGASEINPAG
jgi:hypothetical protein